MNHFKYPSIERLDKAVHLFTPETGIVVQEKLDGSNFGFYYQNGEVVFQSRSRLLDPEPEKMFRPAINSVHLSLDIAFDKMENYPDYVFYGEAIGTGKIKYDTPQKFVLYDVYNREHDSWLTDEEVTALAFRLSLATVHVLYTGCWQGLDHIKSLLGKSHYGDVQAEGVVVKAYYLQGTYTDKETGETAT
jgi:ATP-dependent RNA circularization protein (DNA/RNA ligase family)